MTIATFTSGVEFANAYQYKGSVTSLYFSPQPNASSISYSGTTASLISGGSPNYLSTYTVGYRAGIRFLSFNIPPASTINSAILSLTCKAINTITASKKAGRVVVINSDSAPRFGYDQNEAGGTETYPSDAVLPKDITNVTGTPVEISVPAGATDGTVLALDVTALVQAIVNRPGYNSTSIGFIIEYDLSLDDNLINYYSSDTTSSPVLNVNYSAGAIDSTPPVISTQATASVAENSTLAIALTANESVTWSIVGGADQSQFSITGSTLSWASNGTKDYENPQDANADNQYIVIIRATDTSGNYTDKTITVTVTDVYEAPPNITSQATNYITTGYKLRHKLLADVSVTWSIVSGQDNFQLSGSTLEFLNDAAAPIGTFTVTVKATNTTTGAYSTQTITIVSLALSDPPRPISVGAANSSTVGMTLQLPEQWFQGCLLIMLLETANQVVTTPSGWSIWTNSPQGSGTAGSATATRVSVFYKIAGAIESAVSLADPGDHIGGLIIATTVCDVAAGVGNSGATSIATQPFPTYTTSLYNVGVIAALAYGTDTAVSQINSWSKGFSPIFDAATSIGNGGGVGAAYNTVSNASITTTAILATASLSGRIILPLIPKQQPIRERVFVVLVG